MGSWPPPEKTHIKALILAIDRCPSKMMHGGSHTFPQNIAWFRGRGNAKITTKADTTFCGSS
jgi:transketolase C-terminal domain/subunit